MGMRIDHKLRCKLEDICFKYERLNSLLSCLQLTVSEVVDVVGVPEHALEYSLYEIEMEMYKTNDELSKLINEAESV